MDKQTELTDAELLNLRLRRLALDLTLREVARMIPTAVETLSRWEVGKVIPTPMYRKRWIEVVEEAEKGAHGGLAQQK